MLVTLIYIPIITLVIININLLIFKNVELYKLFKFIGVSFDKIIKIINILSINITLSYSLYIWRYYQILKNILFIIKYITNYYKNITLLIAKPWIFILFTFIISIHWLIQIENTYIWICGIAFIISLIYFGISNLYDVFMNFIKFDIYNCNAIYRNWIYFIYIFILNYKI